MRQYVGAKGHRHAHHGCICLEYICWPAGRRLEIDLRCTDKKDGQVGRALICCDRPIPCARRSCPSKRGARRQYPASRLLSRILNTHRIATERPWSSAKEELFDHNLSIMKALLNAALLTPSQQKCICLGATQRTVDANRTAGGRKLIKGDAVGTLRAPTQR